MKHNPSNRTSKEIKKRWERQQFQALRKWIDEQKEFEQYKHSAWYSAYLQGNIKETEIIKGDGTILQR